MPIAKLPLIELLSSRSTAAFYDVVKPIERLDHGEPTPRLVDQVRSWERKQVDVVQTLSGRQPTPRQGSVPPRRKMIRNRSYSLTASVAPTSPTPSTASPMRRAAV